MTKRHAWLLRREGDSQIPNKCIGGHRNHQGQPSSETRVASTKYVYVPPLLASSISYRPGWAGTLIQNVLDWFGSLMTPSIPCRTPLGSTTSKLGYLFQYVFTASRSRDRLAGMSATSTVWTTGLPFFSVRSRSTL